jgi:hypothetical protein
MLRIDSLRRTSLNIEEGVHVQALMMEHNGTVGAYGFHPNAFDENLD